MCGPVLVMKAVSQVGARSSPWLCLIVCWASDLPPQHGPTSVFVVAVMAFATSLHIIRLNILFVGCS